MSQTIKIVVDDGSFDGDGEVTLSREQGYEFAQMLKRFHFGTAERLSDPTRKDEPQLMIDAVCLVQRGFSQAGIAPR
jgi:hypothetical protein